MRLLNLHEQTLREWFQVDCKMSVGQYRKSIDKYGNQHVYANEVFFLRELLKLSQQELASRLYVKSSIVSRWEAAERNMNITSAEIFWPMLRNAIDTSGVMKQSR